MYNIKQTLTTIVTLQKNAIPHTTLSFYFSLSLYGEEASTPCHTCTYPLIKTWLLPSRYHIDWCTIPIHWYFPRLKQALVTLTTLSYPSHSHFSIVVIAHSSSTGAFASYVFEHLILLPSFHCTVVKVSNINISFTSPIAIPTSCYFLDSLGPPRPYCPIFYLTTHLAFNQYEPTLSLLYILFLHHFPIFLRLLLKKYPPTISDSSLCRTALATAFMCVAITTPFILLFSLYFSKADPVPTFYKGSNAFHFSSLPFYLLKFSFHHPVSTHFL